MSHTTRAGARLVVAGRPQLARMPALVPGPGSGALRPGPSHAKKTTGSRHHETQDSNHPGGGTSTGRRPRGCHGFPRVRHTRWGTKQAKPFLMPMQATPPEVLHDSRTGDPIAGSAVPSP